MTQNNVVNSAFPTVVAKGGSGVASLTAYSVVCAGTTSTAAFQPVNQAGIVAGYVLTYVSSSDLPTWQVASGGLTHPQVMSRVSIGI